MATNQDDVQVLGDSRGFTFARANDFSSASSKGYAFRQLFLPGGVLLVRRHTGAREKLDKKIDFTAVKCVPCVKVLGSAIGNVHNYLKHVQKAHPDIAERLLPTKENDQQTQMSLEVAAARRDHHARASVWSKPMRRLEKRLRAAWVADTHQAMLLTNNTYFRVWHHFATGGCGLESRNTTRAEVVRLATSLESDLKQFLAMVTGWSLTTDSWTGADNLSYCVITLSTIDPQTMEPVDLLLDMHPMPSDHSAAVLQGLIAQTVRKYGLQPSGMVSIVGDGAASQQKAMRDFRTSSTVRTWPRTAWRMCWRCRSERRCTSATTGRSCARCPPFSTRLRRSRRSFAAARAQRWC